MCVETGSGLHLRWFGPRNELDFHKCFVTHRFKVRYDLRMRLLQLVPILFAVELVGCSTASIGSRGDSGAQNDASQPPDGRTDANPGDSGANRVCEADRTRSCACASGRGVERCLADGTGFSGCECITSGTEVFVDESASQGGDGSEGRPFHTLSEARDDIRQKRSRGQLLPGDTTVWLSGGRYELSETLSFDNTDSGSATSAVVFRSLPGEHATLSGGRALDPACFAPVLESDPLYDRLDTSTRTQIQRCDLRAAGISNFGEQVLREGYNLNNSPIELFVDGIRTARARWPDANYHEPGADPSGSTLEVYGTLTPPVAGQYTRTGTSDGLSRFQRNGLVSGLQYYLYRHSGTGGGNAYTAWFLTTNQSGYPSSDNPFWYSYTDALAPMEGAQGAQGIAELERADRIDHGFLRTGVVSGDRTFRIQGTRYQRWTAAPDIWTHGLFRYAWQDTLVGATINFGASTATLQTTPVYGVSEGQEYYFYNLAEEITQPGEYYVERASGVVYFYPPGPIVNPTVSLLESPVIRVNGTAHLQFVDISIENGRDVLVDVDGSSDIGFERVRFANGGASGMRVRDSNRVTIERCEFSELGAAGVDFEGGNRTTLSRADYLVQNSDFHDVGRLVWMYQPAIQVRGVGGTLRQNNIHDVPHSAIIFWGNEHLIERNRISRVCGLSSDAGAIYTGRDWGYRGNVIRHNVISHISTVTRGFGVSGIYLDDVVSGIEIYGNILYDIETNGILHGGGRDDLIHHNIFVRAANGLATDARGPGSIVNTPGDSWNLLARLQDVQYQSDTWRSRYPLCAAIPNTWAQITAPGALWRYPEGTTFVGNLGSELGQMILERDDSLTYFETVSGNIETPDPGFVDAAADNFALRPDSPAFGIAGFEPIPYALIGPSP